MPDTYKNKNKYRNPLLSRAQEIRNRAKEENKNKNDAIFVTEAYVENGETNINIPTAMEYENGMIKDAKQYKPAVWSSIFPQSATPINESKELEKIKKKAGKSNKKKKLQKKRTIRKTTKKGQNNFYF